MQNSKLKPESLPAVLLLGADENESLPILKSLGRKGVHITVAGPHRLSMGFFSRYARKRLHCPNSVTDGDAYVDWVMQTLCGGHYPVTLVCGETATWLVSSHRTTFEEHTRLAVVDSELFLKCRDKALTMKAAKELGIPIPHTYFPDETPIEKISDEIPSYPVVLKPRISNGARGVCFPKTPGDLIENHKRISKLYGPCIVQEFIPHTGMQYKVEVLLDDQQKVLAAGVYNKPRFYPPSGGSSTLNCTVDRPDILDLGVRFLQGIGWKGIGDCDFIEDPRDKSIRLMEVNPRFTRSIKVLVEAGLDFPWLMYQYAIGDVSEPMLDYQKGLYLRYFLSDCVWFLRSKDRFQAKPSFFRFFGKDIRYEIFSWRDPFPSLAFLLWSLLRLLNPRSRRFMLR